MRKLRLLMVAFMAMLGLGANAQEYEVDQRFTSVAALDGQTFYIVNEADEMAFCFGYGDNGWDMFYKSYANGDAQTAKACCFKLSPAEGADVSNYYYLQAYSKDGNLLNYDWAPGGYFNSQAAIDWCCFALGLNGQNGQDIKNGAVWNLEVNGEGKIALKNIGTGKYLKDTAPAKYDDPTYFTFCTLKLKDPLALEKNKYNEIKALVLALDDDATVFEGSATVDISEAEAAFAAATTVEAVEAAIDKLYAAALTFVTSVTVKEGKYFDMTNLWIVNPTVRKNIDGWTLTNPSGYPTGWSSNGVTNYEETEFYQNQFDFYQTLTLPKGTYEFGVTGFHRAGNHSTYFYAGEDKILIPGVESSVVNSMAQAQEYFNAGNGKVSLKFALEDASNTIKIGIVNNDTQTDKWTIFRDFTLHYYGSVCDYSVYQEQWASLVQEAGKAKSDYPAVTGKELTDLNAAIADAPNGQSKANYLEKIQALETALSTFISAAPKYEAYLTYKAETAAIFGNEMANSVSVPTTAAEAETAIHSLNVAQYNKVTSDYTYSCSGLIGDFGTWTGTATVAGQPATPNYLSNEHWSGQTHAYYEQAANGWSNSAGWTIKYEKTCILPAGSYVLKVAARASEGTTGTVSCSATDQTIALPNFSAYGRGINKDGEASWTDGEFARDGVGFGWQWRFLPFTLDQEGEVTMTFYAEAKSQYQWMSIADGELLSATKLAKDIVYDETKENTIEKTIVADVTIKRNIVEGYNTVVLPFLLTANQVLDAFGKDAIVYNFSDAGEKASETIVKFDRGDGSIAANTPVLVKVSEPSTEQVFKGVQIVEGEPVIAGTYYSLTGIYSPKKLTGFDYIMNTDGVAVGSKAATINGFCAYLKVNASTGRIIQTLIDGVDQEVVTGINGLFIENNYDGKIYNLNGQEVKNARKGLYIINGKKVVIK